MNPLHRRALNWLCRRYTARVADVALQHNWSMAPYMPELTTGAPLDVKRVLAWLVAELRTARAVNEELLKDMARARDAARAAAEATTVPAEQEDISRWLSNLGGLEVPAPRTPAYDKEVYRDN